MQLNQKLIKEIIAMEFRWKFSSSRNWLIYLAAVFASYVFVEEDPTLSVLLPCLLTFGLISFTPFSMGSHQNGANNSIFSGRYVFTVIRDKRSLLVANLIGGALTLLLCLPVWLPVILSRENGLTEALLGLPTALVVCCLIRNYSLLRVARQLRMKYQAKSGFYIPWHQLRGFAEFIFIYVGFFYIAIMTMIIYEGSAFRTKAAACLVLAYIVYRSSKSFLRGWDDERFTFWTFRTEWRRCLGSLAFGAASLALLFFIEYPSGRKPASTSKKFESAIQSKDK